MILVQVVFVHYEKTSTRKVTYVDQLQPYQHVWNRRRRPQAPGRQHQLYGQQEGFFCDLPPEQVR